MPSLAAIPSTLRGEGRALKTRPAVVLPKSKVMALASLIGAGCLAAAIAAVSPVLTTNSFLEALVELAGAFGWKRAAVLASDYSLLAAAANGMTLAVLAAFAIAEAVPSHWLGGKHATTFFRVFLALGWSLYALTIIASIAGMGAMKYLGSVVTDICFLAAFLFIYQRYSETAGGAPSDATSDLKAISVARILMGAGLATLLLPLLGTNAYLVSLLAHAVSVATVIVFVALADSILAGRLWSRVLRAFLLVLFASVQLTGLFRIANEEYLAVAVALALPLKIYFFATCIKLVRWEDRRLLDSIEFVGTTTKSISWEQLRSARAVSTLVLTCVAIAVGTSAFNAAANDSNPDVLVGIGVLAIVAVAVCALPIVRIKRCLLMRDILPASIPTRDIN